MDDSFPGAWRTPRNPEFIAHWLRQRNYTVTAHHIVAVQKFIFNFVRDERIPVTVTRNGVPIIVIQPLPEAAK